MDNKEMVKKAGTVIVNKSVISTAGLITILLIILKLTDNIEIGWLWCFAAYWLPLAIIFGIMLIIMVGALLIGVSIALYDEYDSRKRR